MGISNPVFNNLCNVWSLCYLHKTPFATYMKVHLWFLHPVRTDKDQLMRIFQLTGSPEDEYLEKISNVTVSSTLLNLCIT